MCGALGFLDKGSWALVGRQGELQKGLVQGSKTINIALEDESSNTQSMDWKLRTTQGGNLGGERRVEVRRDLVRPLW